MNKAKIQRLVQQAVRAAGVTEEVTWKSFVSSSYNATTGAPTRSEIAVTVPVVFAYYRLEEQDGQAIVATDRKVLVTALDLGAIVPDENDRIVRANGEIWNVKTVHEDAAGARFLCQVRQ